MPATAGGGPGEPKPEPEPLLPPDGQPRPAHRGPLTDVYRPESASQPLVQPPATDYATPPPLHPPSSTKPLPLLSPQLWLLSTATAPSLMLSSWRTSDGGGKLDLSASVLDFCPRHCLLYCGTGAGMVLVYELDHILEADPRPAAWRTHMLQHMGPAVPVPAVAPPVIESAAAWRAHRETVIAVNAIEPPGTWGTVCVLTASYDQRALLWSMHGAYLGCLDHFGPSGWSLGLCDTPPAPPAEITDLQGVLRRVRFGVGTTGFVRLRFRKSRLHFRNRRFSRFFV